MTKSNLDAALALARRGFSIFPLKAYDPATTDPDGPIKAAKKPAIKQWPIAATTDEARISEWWRNSPRANIGVYTGNLLVLDVDPDKGGSNSLAELKDMFGGLKETYTVVTQSGGMHLYFALPDHVNVACSQGEVGAGLDVRGDGGYVVGPGSTIGKKEYLAISLVKTLELAPAWLIALCKAPAKGKPGTNERLVDETPAALVAADRWLQTSAPTAHEGERNHTAYSIVAKFYDFGLWDETAHSKLLEWNETKCSPPLGPDEIATIARSAKTKTQNPRGILSPDLAVFEPIAENATPNPRTEKPLKFRSTPAAELAGRALTIVGMPLVRGVLDRNTTAVIYGPSGGGKTFGALDICYHVHRGRAWCEKPVHQGGVLYLAAEGGPGINKRLRALEMKYGPLDPTLFHVLPAKVDFLRGNDAREVYAEIQRLEAEHKHKIELVVVDTLSRVMPGGDENGPQDMTRVVATLDSLREAAKATALMIHHTGKDVSKGLRGHSSLIAAVDTEIKMEKRLFTVKKQRDMEGNWSMRFDLEPVRIGPNLDGEDVKSCTIKFHAKTAAVEVGSTGAAAQMLLAVAAEMKRLGPNAPATFGWQFCEPLLAETDTKTGKKSFPTRQTITGNLSELSENGSVEKIDKNQYVIVVGNVSESVGNQNG